LLWLDENRFHSREMSSEDSARPYHAGKRTPSEEAADAVAAVLSHAAAREEAQHKKDLPRRAQAKWALPLGINLGVFALYLLIAPPSWVVMKPLADAPIEEQVDDMRLAMYMQAMRVDAYHAQNGVLPEALEDAGSSVPGVEYVVMGANRYELVATIGTEVVRYDSSESANAWVGSGAAGKLKGTS